MVLRVFATALAGRNRVDTAFRKRVTAQDAFQCQPAAVERAMASNRFDGITGTGWVKAAVAAEKRADQVLVAANQQCQQAYDEISDHGVIRSLLSVAAKHNAGSLPPPVRSGGRLERCGQERVSGSDRFAIEQLESAQGALTNAAQQFGVIVE